MFIYKELSYWLMQSLIDNTPMGREGEATDIANIVDLLVDDRAGFLSSIDILCDGGAIANFKKIRTRG